MIAFPENCTIGDMYHPAMKITTQEEANEYFESTVQYSLNQNPEMGREKAERIQKSNFGYFAGYYDNETRERVERLFCCEHPIFGSIKKNGSPTPEEAFEMGKNLSKK
ncbi:MAG: hypothetical protein IMZ52_00310 [Actinobacteria bacterium]|nr:hypothetical protein [Actinomycetota bacterium]